MKKKSKNLTGMLFFIGIIILIGVIAWGGTHGWFSFVFQNIVNPPSTPLPGQIVKEYLSYNLNLNLNPTNICSGERVTGTITSNIYGGVCSIFVDTGTGYTLFSNVNLNSMGGFSQSEVVSAIGTARFQAVCCDASGNCKISNTVTLISRDCPDTPACTDSDGNDIYKPGWITTDYNYYDNCAGNWAVTEYFCRDGAGQSITTACPAGYICYETRSGDYCKSTAPADSDGDGFSDSEESDAGTNPNDAYDYPGSPLITCSNHCKDIGYAGATIHATDSTSCQSLSIGYCAEANLPFDYSTYNSQLNCCCYDCIGY